MKTLSFITDDNTIDKEALRVYAADELDRLKNLFQAYAHSAAGEQTFSALKNAIGLMENKFEKEQNMVVLRQISGLPAYIEDWKDMAVESAERFEFFILTKAEEVKSGNEKKDYFWALMIRHDQLLGLIEVLTAILFDLQRFIHLPVSSILKDSHFTGLLTTSIEDQVYLKAESIYKTRANAAL